jgi:AraC-like DNA-binding protein
MDFILNNYRISITADSVAEHIHMSPKTLHRKFKKFFGCSVFEKISQIRMEHISELLVETHIPIYRIAKEVGDLNSKHLSRMFKKMKNMTPAGYRAKHQIT